MKRANKKDVCFMTVLTIFGIICFPANPLVLTGVIKVESYTALFIIGCAVWVFGMVLVMAPIIQFPRRGGVPKGKSFVHTTQMVDTGIYAVVRHPQYTGGIYGIFVTTLLWYPHWLFAVLGVLGATATFLSCKEEDKRLVQQFGDDYKDYMQRVPRMNIFLGLFRLLQRRNK
jgi:protein-S-isoprenylcysteine O-methyltransferase Ste14